MIRRWFCKHNWRNLYNGFYVPSKYGCTKCGKINKVDILEDGVWRFKREMKGDTFE